MYGPPLGIRYVLFIDDMNVATVDKYKVNSAVELLRHWIEFGFWYNLKDASVVRLIDMQVCSTFHHTNKLSFRTIKQCNLRLFCSVFVFSVCKFEPRFKEKFLARKNKRNMLNVF